MVRRSLAEAEGRRRGKWAQPIGGGLLVPGFTRMNRRRGGNQRHRCHHYQAPRLQVGINSVRDHDRSTREKTRDGTDQHGEGLAGDPCSSVVSIDGANLRDHSKNTVKETPHPPRFSGREPATSLAIGADDRR